MAAITMAKVNNATPPYLLSLSLPFPTCKINYDHGVEHRVVVHFTNYYEAVLRYQGWHLVNGGTYDIDTFKSAGDIHGDHDGFFLLKVILKSYSVSAKC